MAKVAQLVRQPAEPASPERLAEVQDEALMGLVRLDSRAAFRVLVTRHATKVASFCARMAGDRAAGLEAAQETWLTLWDGRRRWEARSTFKAFLFTIAFSRAKNQARSIRRRALFAPLPIERDIRVDDSPSELDRVLERERAEQLWSALGSLSEAHREAVVLRFVEDLSYEEMAKILGVVDSTLRSRVFHGLAELKRRLSKEEK